MLSVLPHIKRAEFGIPSGMCLVPLHEAEVTALSTVCTWHSSQGFNFQKNSCPTQSDPQRSETLLLKRVTELYTE